VSAHSNAAVPAWFAITATTVLALAVAGYLHMLFRRWGALEHEVHHDALTGLPNRNHFNLRLQLAMDHAHRSGGDVLVMFLDLDRFKNVNDSLGHAAGNALLTQVAVRLRDAVPHGAVVARLSGDEFAVLVTDVHDDVAASTAVLEEFAVPFELGRRQLYVTPSIGIAQYPADGATPSELLHHADTAMYRAKEKGRNTVEHYRKSSRANAVSRLDIETGLHRAVDEGQLRVHYQPKVSAGHRITGVEALVRWDHPGFGLIGPTEFVPIAEESGIIAEIGEWVLLEACAQGKRWHDAAHGGIHIAVNLSPRQFQLQHVPDLVAQALRFTKLPPHLLELEITESLALHDPKLAAAALDELRSMGVSCAIDDFGVGYSGLGYIDQFAIDAVKIDRQFVKRIDAKGAPIVTAVIAMAAGLGIRAIAEGVETSEQFAFLTDHGCDELQGFYISRPATGDAVSQMLVAQAASPAASRRHFVGV
jgi:diguanylate cyclase (GGDEF)-like protein